MDNPQKERPSTTGAAIVHSAFSAFAALDSPGRRGIRIFGLPREQLIMATVAAVLLGIPLSFIVAMAPFWDRVGEVALLKQLNSYVAPAIDGLAYEYRAEAFPRFPLKRFLIASTTMVELVFLSNFVALFARGVRRHALLVWTCYDRTKLLRYFGLSCLGFCSLWFVLFFDWTVLSFLFSPGGRGARLVPYFVVAMPVVAAVFGHMAAIVGLGGWRTASRKLRRLRKAFL
jgi:hypothetical protein